MAQKRVLSMIFRLYVYTRKKVNYRLRCLFADSCKDSNVSDFNGSFTISLEIYFYKNIFPTAFESQYDEEYQHTKNTSRIFIQQTLRVVSIIVFLLNFGSLFALDKH